MIKKTAGKSEEGKRLDKFLAEELPSYSRGEISRFIKEGKVSVAGKSAKPSHVLAAGEVVQAEGISFEKGKEIMSDAQVQARVIFECADFAVLDKSAGVSVHPKEVEEKGAVANWLISRYGEDIRSVQDGSPDAYLRPGIVHRLDKDTSGVMVVAKNKKALEEFKEIFAERKARKEYVAVVSGRLEKEKGKIEKPLARKAGERKQTIAGRNSKTKVRSAITEYELLRQEQGWAVVLVKPQTGRMHQIRVHLADLGHPIMGDKLYGGTESNILGARRQLLHAWKLSFEFGGQKYAFKSPFPPDMVDLVGNID